MKTSKKYNSSDVDAILSQIIEDGKHLAGRSEAIRFYKGERLTLAEAIRANCFVCNGMETRDDCRVYTCPLYPFMVYNPDRVSYTSRKGPIRQKKEESVEEFLARMDAREREKGMEV